MKRMPALFIGHGSPMNAIEDNPFSRAWAALAQQLRKPEAILCVSAHWETRGTSVTASARPETIHDFHGFPRELFAVQYPARGSQKLAAQVVQLLSGTTPVQLDEQRGLDHGAWSVLLPMYAGATIPVVQLSLDATQGPAFHYQLGQLLAPLRREGVLLMGSGNLVHNLGIMDWQRAGGFDWAERIDARARQLMAAGEHAALIAYETLDEQVNLAVPTPEHYLPLLYTVGAQLPGDRVRFFNERCVMGSISMTSVVLEN